MLTLSDPEANMARHTNSPTIYLPRGWPRPVKSTMLHVIALDQYAIAYTRIWAITETRRVDYDMQSWIAGFVR